MAILRQRKIGNKHYFYIEHSYKVGNKTKILSRYVGSKKPHNIDKINDDIELEAMRKVWLPKIEAIRKKHKKEQKLLPKTAKQKRTEVFMIDFVFNSDKIEGSSLSLKDTSGLFMHGITPRNKPISDVKEAEGHKNAFYDMLSFKEELDLKKIRQWHKSIFENSDAAIAGKIRIHKIMVGGSRVSFPHPESLNKLLDEFFSWYKKSQKLYNPVELAALTHLKFVTIHPFTDGNGRISRILVNYIFNKNGFPLWNLKFSNRKPYYSALEKSQLWNKEKYFLRFFIKDYVKANYAPD